MTTIKTKTVILKDREKEWGLRIKKHIYETKLGRLVEYCLNWEIDAYSTFWLNGKRLGDVSYKCDRGPMYIFYPEIIKETLNDVGLYIDKYGKCEYELANPFTTEWKHGQSEYTILTEQEKFLEQLQYEQFIQFQKKEMDKWWNEEKEYYDFDPSGDGRCSYSEDIEMFEGELKPSSTHIRDSLSLVDEDDELPF